MTSHSQSPPATWMAPSGAMKASQHRRSFQIITSLISPCLVTKLVFLATGPFSRVLLGNLSSSIARIVVGSLVHTNLEHSPGTDFLCGSPCLLKHYLPCRVTPVNVFYPCAHVCSLYFIKYTSFSNLCIFNYSSTPFSTLASYPPCFPQISFPILLFIYPMF